MSNLKRYTLYILNLIDALSIIVAHFIAYFLRSYFFVTLVPFVERTDYTKNLLFAILAYVFYTIMVQYSDERFLERNRWDELRSVLKMVIYVIGLPLLYLYITKQSDLFSRIYFGFFSIFLIIINFIVRGFVKKYIIPKYKTSSNVEDILIITALTYAEKVIDQLNDPHDWRYLIKGVIITDKNMIGQKVSGLPVLSNRMHMFDYVDTAEIDSVLIVTGDESRATINWWIRKFREAGKIIHLKVNEYDFDGAFRSLDQLGKTAVVTYRMISPMPKRQVFFRRSLDIITCVLLLPIFILITLIVLVFTHFESPGRLLVPRIRVGKNNRRFYQYRFRLYHLNAQERIQQGLSPYTKIGCFLKKTHLDGIPVLLNILGGDMSFIGPKAPDLQTYLKMSTKERNIFSINPGAIGYWSCEKDNDHIFEQEQLYIEQWNPLKDFTIVISTILHYLTGRSLQRLSPYHEEEELSFANEELEAEKPLDYDRSAYTIKKTAVYYLYHFIKRLLDIILSVIGIIVFIPLMIVLAFIIIEDDGGNPFYTHQRIGLNGKRIRVYKFRSMRRDAGELEKLLTPEQIEQYKKEFKVDADPRITDLGEFIRRTSLDELPQLFNILFGTLSFVGPRPIVEEETKKYGKDVAKLLSTKPGLTGYWQAYARNNAQYDNGERQAMEMYYIDHQNLWLDTKIFFRTFRTVFSGEGAK